MKSQTQEITLSYNDQQLRAESDGEQLVSFNGQNLDIDHTIAAMEAQFDVSDTVLEAIDHTELTAIASELGLTYRHGILLDPARFNTEQRAGRQCSVLVKHDLALPTFASDRAELGEPETPAPTRRRPSLLRRALAGAALSAAVVSLSASPALADSYDTHHQTVIINNPGLAEIEARYPVGAVPTYTVSTLNIQNKRFRGNISERSKAAVELLTGRSDAPASDIIGIQEDSSEQANKIRSYLPAAYKMFPKHTDENRMFVNTNTFQVLNSGVFKYSSYGDVGTKNGTNGSWIVVRHKQTGELMTFTNLRMPAWNEDRGSDAGGAIKRFHDAKILVALNRTLNNKYPGSTQHNIGDFNSTYQRRLKPQEDSPKPNKDKQVRTSQIPMHYMDGFVTNTVNQVQGYDHFVESPIMKKAYNNFVDQQFSEVGAIVRSWQVTNNKVTRKATDHPELTVTYIVNPDIK